PRHGPGHLRGVMEKLEQTTPGGETGLSDTFHQLAESIKRRSLVVVLSDLLDDPAPLVGALKHFRHQKHEVVVLHTLDPAEVTFPFDDITCIEDLETRREVVSDPRAFRKAYLEELDKFLEVLRAGWTNSQIGYPVGDTVQR